MRDAAGQVPGASRGAGFVVELDFFSGRKKFDGTEVVSLLHYDNNLCLRSCRSDFPAMLLLRL